jgi:large repetitive protein
LWVTEGALPGARNSRAFSAVNNGVDGPELWTPDGTAAGTVRVKDIQPGAGGCNPASLTNVDGTLYCQASDDAHGDERGSGG